MHLERKLKTYPEVDYVFSKIGTAEIATDPMPPSVADTYVMLKPKGQPGPIPAVRKADLVKQLETDLLKLPGNNYEFIQPIQMRFNELIAGVRSDVAVKVFGDDRDTLDEVGADIEQALAAVPGASDVKLEQTTGLPVLTIEVDRAAISRLGLNVADVQEVIEVAIGGRDAGQVYEGDRRFDLIVAPAREAARRHRGSEAPARAPACGPWLHPPRDRSPPLPRSPRVRIK
jgi:cobalt-zinc-cadmium resistance protein CzcA